MTVNKEDIKTYTYEELEQYLTANGFEKFRANQIFQWLHEKLVTNVTEMSNIPKKLSDFLTDNTEIDIMKILEARISKIDGTTKYLFELRDGNIIESVLMKYKHGNSVCISSQVGCRMGCRFCASTLGGLVRNLAPSEMLEQIYRIQATTGERVSNIVLMGSGEPLDNFDNVIKFLTLINSDKGLNISYRNITLSTCGLVNRMKELQELKLPITLAVSLHASSDEKRKELMPIANKYSIEEIINVCRSYIEATGRRVTFEYSLVQGVNDSIEDARRLYKLLKGMLVHINLIPVNPIKEREYKSTLSTQVQAFKKYLENNKLNVTVRREMGQDIQAACGQLRKSYIERNGN